jgi:hypothetical protein
MDCPPSNVPARTLHQVKKTPVLTAVGVLELPDPDSVSDRTAVADEQSRRGMLEAFLLLSGFDRFGVGDRAEGSRMHGPDVLDRE